MPSFLMPSRELTFDTIFTQCSIDFRRYRDYELTAAGWFSALQIGLASVIGRLPDQLAQVLRNHKSGQLVFALLVCLIGLCGILSVAYANERKRQLGKILFEEWDLRSTCPLPKSTGFTPYFFVLANLVCIPVANLLLGGVSFGWSARSLLISGGMLLCLLVLAAAMGKKAMFRRPAKQKVRVLLLDSDVLAWLTKDGNGYQTRANRVLRELMMKDLEGE